MEYRHFSHQHHLNLYQVQQGQEFLCSGCETKCCSDSVYACWQCNFFLHEHCGNANRFIKHPSHPLHPLILLPSPTYCGGAFLCNACGATGKAFSYSCALCQVDLHLHCAFLPPTANHKSHPHELILTHTDAQNDPLPYNCKICNKMLQSDHWNYQCPKCEFDAHTFCATNEVKPGLYLDDEDESDPATLNLAGHPGPHQGGGATNGDDEGAGVVLEVSEEELVELFKLQLQLQMAAEQFAAEVVASSSNNLSSSK